MVREVSGNMMESDAHLYIFDVGRDKDGEATIYAPQEFYPPRVKEKAKMFHDWVIEDHELNHMWIIPSEIRLGYTARFVLIIDQPGDEPQNTELCIENIASWLKASHLSFRVAVCLAGSITMEMLEEHLSEWDVKVYRP